MVGKVKMIFAALLAALVLCGLSVTAFADDTADATAAPGDVTAVDATTDTTTVDAVTADAADAAVEAAISAEPISPDVIGGGKEEPTPAPVVEEVAAEPAPIPQTGDNILVNAVSRAAFVLSLAGIGTVLVMRKRRTN